MSDKFEKVLVDTSDKTLIAELYRRYKKLKELFIIQGFCESCPCHLDCHKRGMKCEQMLEVYLREH